MSRFIIAANIAHFKELLAKETDPLTIETLRRLLAEEERKLGDIRLFGPASKATE